MLLSQDNYSKGFLIDEELMGGVSENPDPAGGYIAFVLRHTTGEYLGYRKFDRLEDALEAINQVQRPWTYEKSAGCGGCGDGSCGRGSKGCSESKKSQCKSSGGACAGSPEVPSQ